MIEILTDQISEVQISEVLTDVLLAKTNLAEVHILGKISLVINTDLSADSLKEKAKAKEAKARGKDQTRVFR